MPSRATRYPDMWVDPEDDPREGPPAAGELAILRKYLTHYRFTLRMKCDGLSSEQLATRAVPPSTMSLLGLVRHLAQVEHSWFQRALQARLDTPRPFWSAEETDLDFDGPRAPCTWSRSTPVTVATPICCGSASMAARGSSGPVRACRTRSGADPAGAAG